MLGIPLGFLTINAVEWLFHKHILHGLGKNKNSMWSDHWKVHHKTARKNGMIDKDYLESWFVIIQSSEFKAIFIGALFLIPFLIKVPYFVTTVWLCGTAYFVIHRQSHIDEKWAKKYVPWHVEHHLMGNQEHSWNVTFPLTDYIMGTRFADVKKGT